MTGDLRTAPILRDFRKATSLALAASIADRMLKGERLFEKHIISRYNQKTGQPERWTWVPSDQYWGEQLVFWPSSEWNYPSLHDCPVAKILLKATKAGPILIGNILFRYCHERSEPDGTTPESIIVERVRVHGGT